MEKKRFFDLPEAIVITFDNQDVIVTSSGGPNDTSDPNQEWED